MASFNKVILMGNLTRDPEIRSLPSGMLVANFGLATSRKYKQGDELKEEVCFTDIVVFGKQAENCGKYLTKGNGIMLDGRLSQRRWEDADGQKRSKHEVVAESIQFLPKKPSGSSAGSSEGGTSTASGGERSESGSEEFGEEMPF
jgi:single-strand DNA-binding protein